MEPSGFKYTRERCPQLLHLSVSSLGSEEMCRVNPSPWAWHKVSMKTVTLPTRPAVGQSSVQSPQRLRVASMSGPFMSHLTLQEAQGKPWDPRCYAPHTT